MMEKSVTIRSINDFCAWWGDDIENIEKSIYKSTDCGSWIHWDDKSIRIGSIVEGSDAEVEFESTFRFPFESSEIDDWLTELERLTDEARHEVNDEKEAL